MTIKPDMNTGTQAPEYTRHGFVLCPIPHGRKGPTSGGWNLIENAITTPATAAMLTGNVGLLHAWSCTMALDVDDWGAASEWLLARGVNLGQLFAASDGVQIVSGRVGRGKLLFRLPASLDAPAETVQIKGDSGEMILEFRCADRGGNSVQDVLPPSIHPDTGMPYQWGGSGDWRRLPVIPDALLQIWHGELAKRTTSSAAAAPSSPPLGLPPQSFAPPPGFARLEEGLFGLTVMESALDYVSADIAYDEWRNIIWAIMSTGWRCAPQIAHSWSKLAPHRYNAVAVDALIRGFDPTRGITIASLFHHAKQNGWTMPQQYPLAVVPSPPPLPPPPIGPLLTASELQRLPTVPYVVRGLLPVQGLVAIYGEPGSGKSFLALDLAHAVAKGRPSWFGFPVQQTPVAYVALEGQTGMAKRVAAVEKHTGQPCDSRMRFWCREFQLLSDESVQFLAVQILATIGSGAIVIIDTLNQASPGADENSPQDMGRIIANAKRVAALVGGLVVLVHHAGKNRSLGLRGHSSLLAAMDAVIEVLRETAGRKWRVAKAKDDSGDISRDFELVTHDVGQDAYGPIRSCAVLQTAHASVIAKAPVRGRHQKPALGELRRLLTSPGQVMDYKTAISHVAGVLVAKGKERDRAKEAIDALFRGGHLSISDKGVSLVH
jgi:hypothetical protein